MANNPEINHREYDDLVSGNLRTVYFNRARLTCRGIGCERRFFMDGPSGSHSMLVSITDINRLNAHWSIFACNPINGYSEINK